jgi:methionine-rich copper-binding protein CopC
MVSGVRTLTFAGVWLIVSGLGLAAMEGPVWAHAELMKSSPINGAALTSSPSVIRAWFSEELAESGSYLRLYDAHNKILATGGLDSKVSNHEALRLTPPRLSAGSYLVRWHVVAADDNAVTQGSFRFSIGGQAMAPSGMTASSPPPFQLIAPADHASVKNPVALIIETSGDMKKLTMGGTGQMGGIKFHGRHGRRRPSAYRCRRHDGHAEQRPADGVGQPPVPLHAGAPQVGIAYCQGVLGG